MAHKLGAEVVGATSNVYGTNGRFVQFTPEGSVKRDRLYSPVDLWVNRLFRGDHTTPNPQDEAWFERELNPQRKSVAAPKLASPVHQFKP